VALSKSRRVSRAPGKCSLGSLVKVDKHLAGGVIRISICDGVQGPPDILALGWPNQGQFVGRAKLHAKLFVKRKNWTVDDMDEKLADYLRSGGTIVIGHGFAKNVPVPVGKNTKRVRNPKR
jgi:hypothetical protein